MPGKRGGQVQPGKRRLTCGAVKEVASCWAGVCRAVGVDKVTLGRWLGAGWALLAKGCNEPAQEWFLHSAGPWQFLSKWSVI